MSNLENYIKEHRTEFDDTEPSPGHLDRFSARLAEPSINPSAERNRWQLLKVAAIILLLISLSVILFDFIVVRISDRMSNVAVNAELSGELNDAMLFYDNQTNEQIAILGKLTMDNHEVQAMSQSALKEIQSLDASTAELKGLLSKNTENERIQDAIIQNQRMKSDILHTVINQISNKTK